MNVIGKPDVFEHPSNQPKAQTPQTGETEVEWHTSKVQNEQSGVICEVYVWNGEFWECHDLDAHHTVEDLYDLNQEIGGEL